MLLNNENQHPKVHEWINDETRNGKLDIVTGYFTIGKGANGQSRFTSFK